MPPGTVTVISGFQVAALLPVMSDAVTVGFASVKSDGRGQRNDAIRAAYQRGATYSRLQEVTGLDGIDRMVKRREG